MVIKRISMDCGKNVYKTGKNKIRAPLLRTSTILGKFHHATRPRVLSNDR